MKSASQNYENYNSPNKRTIALALLICFISISLISGAFILTHVDHVHDQNGIGGSCITCVQMQNAENVLRLLVTAAVGCFTFFAYYATTTPAMDIYSNTVTLTPITAKTRMNN